MSPSTPPEASCPNCKQPVTPGDRLCPNCGAALSAPPPSSDTGRLLTGIAWLDTLLGFLLVSLGIPLLSWGTGAAANAMSAQSNGEGGALGILVYIIGIIGSLTVADVQRAKLSAFARGLRGGLWFWVGVMLLIILIFLGAIVVCVSTAMMGPH